MSFERWNEGAAYRVTGIPAADWRALERTAPVLVAVELEAGGAGNVTTVVHSLGRIPRGLRIVNVNLNTVPSGGETVTWYRLSSDAAWTERELSARFMCDDGELLLEVF